MIVKKCSLCNGENQQEDFNNNIEYSIIDWSGIGDLLYFGNGETAFEMSIPPREKEGIPGAPDVPEMPIDPVPNN